MSKEYTYGQYTRDPDTGEIFDSYGNLVDEHGRPVHPRWRRNASHNNELARNTDRHIDVIDGRGTLQNESSSPGSIDGDAERQDYQQRPQQRHQDRRSYQATQRAPTIQYACASVTPRSPDTNYTYTQQRTSPLNVNPSQNAYMPAMPAIPISNTYRTDSALRTVPYQAPYSYGRQIPQTSSQPTFQPRTSHDTDSQSGPASHAVQTQSRESDSQDRPTGYISGQQRYSYCTREQSYAATESYGDPQDGQQDSQEDSEDYDNSPSRGTRAGSSTYKPNSAKTITPHRHQGHTDSGDRQNSYARRSTTVFQDANGESSRSQQLQSNEVDTILSHSQPWDEEEFERSDRNQEDNRFSKQDNKVGNKDKYVSDLSISLSSQDLEDRPSIGRSQKQSSGHLQKRHEEKSYHRSKDGQGHHHKSSSKDPRHKEKEKEKRDTKDKSGKENRNSRYRRSSREDRESRDRRDSKEDRDRKGGSDRRSKRDGKH